MTEAQLERAYNLSMWADHCEYSAARNFTFARLELYNNQSSVQSTHPLLERSAIQAYNSKKRLQPKLLITD